MASTAELSSGYVKEARVVESAAQMKAGFERKDGCLAHMGR